MLNFDHFSPCLFIDHGGVCGAFDGEVKDGKLPDMTTFYHSLSR